MGTLQGQDPVCSSEPLELVDGAVGRRLVGAGQGGILGRLASEQGPSLLGIGLAYSPWIWLPENRGMPFSRKGVPPAERGYLSHTL